MSEHTIYMLLLWIGSPLLYVLVGFFVTTAPWVTSYFARYNERAEDVAHIITWVLWPFALSYWTLQGLWWLRRVPGYVWRVLSYLAGGVADIARHHRSKKIQVPKATAVRW